MKLRSVILLLVASAALSAQPKIIDSHVHHNGETAFLDKLVARLEALDGMACLLTAPKDLEQVKGYMKRHPNRLVGYGEISLDDPQALALVDRFHAAGFRGLGELLRPLKRYDDRSYWPIYERAEKLGLILLFHTGIVARGDVNKPEDVSFDRMRASTLDGVARRFPKVTIQGAHLGNPEYDVAAEVARWNPNLHFDLSGSTLIKKSEDYTFFKSIFWWSSVVSPHTPKSGVHAFETVVFGSDVFRGELEELDRSIERYTKMMEACGLPEAARRNIMSGTMWRILNRE